MSYEIVYDRQFIKLEVPNSDVPWIIPLTLHGSNNCTEYTSSGRERRERNWNAIYFNGANKLPIEHPDKMIERLNDFCGTKYQEHFKRNGKWVDDAGLIRFFKNGIKYAKTLEELNELSYSPVYVRCHVSIWVGYDNQIELRRVAHNSAELLQFLLDAKQRIDNRSEKELVYVKISFPWDKAVPDPKEVKKRSKRVFEGSYWVLKDTIRDAYIEKLTSRRLLFCHSSSYCRKFATEQEALKWVEEKIIPRFGNRVNLVAEEIVI